MDAKKLGFYLGPFLNAYLLAQGRSPLSQKEIQRRISAMLKGEI